MKIIVKPHQIKLVKDEDVNEKEINISKCEFEFDDRITNEFTKEAYFTLGRRSYKQIIVNDECDFPSEVLEYTGNVEIGVVAFKIDENNKETRFNPTPRTFPTKKGSLKTNAQNSTTPTPSELEQITSLLNSKQDRLISGTNIKTINNESLLGSGNITVQGGGGTATNIDNITITNNSNNEIQTVAVIDNNTGYADKMWIGTSQQYEAIQTKDSNTLYYITDDDTSITDIKVNNVSVLNNGVANITVPTSLSQLSEDTTHRIVTDTEKQTWNNKSNFSGSYNDLSNKPTIPAEVTETTVANWGFTKNTGTYSKPSGGIPETDLASDVQTSLGKADTAIQQSDLADYQLKSTIQDVTGTSVTITPTDNIIYKCGELTSLTIANPPATGAYSIIFTSGSTATTTVIPNTMLGLEDFAAEANTIYEINVLDNRAVVGSWEV